MMAMDALMAVIKYLEAKKPKLYQQTLKQLNFFCLFRKDQFEVNGTFKNEKNISV